MYLYGEVHTKLKAGYYHVVYYYCVKAYRPKQGFCFVRQPITKP